MTYDPMNITIKDLDKGFVLDYNLKTWEIFDAFEYDYENNLSRLFLLSDGTKEVLLFFEKLTYLYLFDEFSLAEIDAKIKRQILTNGIPPENIIREDKTFLLDREVSGHKRTMGTRNTHDWYRVFLWRYSCESGDDIILIEQKGSDEMKSYIGRRISENEFSNIIPKK